VGGVTPAPIGVGPLRRFTALRRPVEAWNVFVHGDTDLVELDAKRLGPQERHFVLTSIDAAKPIVESAAADRNTTTEQAGEVLTAGIETVSTTADNINARQAQDLVAGTSKNLIVQLVRRAYASPLPILGPMRIEL